jgi:hypothetical protein
MKASVATPYPSLVASHLEDLIPRGEDPLRSASTTQKAFQCRHLRAETLKLSQGWPVADGVKTAGIRGVSGSVLVVSLTESTL